MKAPSIWQAFWPSALWMALAFVLILVFVRGEIGAALFWSSLPLIDLLEPLLKPLMSFFPASQRLQITLWLMLVVSYVQWTLFTTGLAYAWRLWRFSKGSK